MIQLTRPTTYLYDHQGARVKRTTPSITTYYPSKYTTTYATTTEDSLYAGGTLIATYSNATGIQILCSTNKKPPVRHGRL